MEAVKNKQQQSLQSDSFLHMDRMVQEIPSQEEVLLAQVSSPETYGGG